MWPSRAPAFWSVPSVGMPVFVDEALNLLEERLGLVKSFHTRADIDIQLPVKLHGKAPGVDNVPFVVDQG